MPHRPRASWQNDLNGTEDISRAVLSGMDVDILDHTINDISLSQGDFSQRAGSEEGVEEIYNVGLDLPNNDRQLNISQDFSSATQAAPNSDDLDNFFWHLPFDVSQMGITGYKDMIQTASIIFEENDLRIFATNSPFSDHIWSVEQLIRQRLQDSPSVIHRSTRTCVLPCSTSLKAQITDFLDSIQNLVSSMISAFICISWKPMSSFLRYTKSHISVTKLTTSHVHNGQQNDSELEIYYRPTHTQLSTPHPAVIDWVPFPSIRDRLILFHASNPRLDEIICEIADAYACDIQLSRLVQGFSPTIGYIRVRDLLQTISRGAEEASDEMPYPSDDHDYVEYNLFSSHEFSQPINSTYNQTSSPSFSHERNSHASRSDLPAPSINALFSSRTLALQVFRLLGMDKGPGSLRLDPVFFRKHPELYDGRTDLLARGVPVRSPSNDTTRLAGPEPIDFRILRKYQEMVKSTFEITPIDTWKDGDGFVAGV